MNEAFQSGSGLAMETLYEFFAGITIVTIALWAAWVIWSSWKSVQLGRLDPGSMASVWTQAIAIVVVLVALVLI